MTIKKRVDRLEELHAPEKELPSAWVAIIDTDGVVRASHIKHGKYEFQSIEEFEAFKAGRGITNFDCLSVEIVNRQTNRNEH